MVHTLGGRSPPPQEYITELARRYQIVNHDLNYALDNYMILAQK